MPDFNSFLPKPELPLGRYRHYKGGEYEVVTLAVNEATHEWMVVYRALYDTGTNPDTWIRTYEDFTATLDDGKLRFTKI